MTSKCGKPPSFISHQGKANSNKNVRPLHMRMTTVMKPTDDEDLKQLVLIRVRWECRLCTLGNGLFLLKLNIHVNFACMIILLGVSQTEIHVS